MNFGSQKLASTHIQDIESSNSDHNLIVCCLFCLFNILKSKNCESLVAFLVPLESSLQGGVHKLYFVVFGPMVCKKLSIQIKSTTSHTVTN